MGELKKKAPTEQLVFEQYIERPIEEVYEFFGDAHNLEKITPPFLNFKVLDQSTPKIQEGTVFNYRLKVRGIPIHWRSRIIQWKTNENFVDYQLKGPYLVWHHTHRFIPYKNGVLMYDIVRYKSPGWLFEPFVNLYVTGDVKKIFQYRYKVIAEIFKK